MNFKFLAAFCCLVSAGASYRARATDVWPVGEYLDDDVKVITSDRPNNLEIKDKDGGALKKITVTGYLLSDMQFDDMDILVIAVHSPKGLQVANAPAPSRVVPCLILREEALKNPFPRLIPECDADGDYNQRQCLYGDKERCQCWSRDGRPLSHSFANVVDCECHRERDDASRPESIGRFVPRCNRDGTYKSKQCWDTFGICWCSTPDGRQISDIVEDYVDCSYVGNRQ
ncbi:SPARC-related modular calcium-binding protein 1-like [Centruroides sculpturatus]|uniref:SPARC-related modular calcium-binding protein 1-like n=1 Tax=Centruroides sculpturatus TaxID=218467 RepID=UPI000C6E8959|nr:SPARC-related modular calcium-binding protein 1-like [Centruroides sculpturatus]